MKILASNNFGISKDSGNNEAHTKIYPHKDTAKQNETKSH